MHHPTCTRKKVNGIASTLTSTRTGERFIMTEAHTAVDPIALRKAFGTFVTGVTIVTTYDSDGNPRGMTANSFTSVSLDPPLLLICIGKSASSYEAFGQTESFAVNFLHEGQIDVSGVFASKSADKFDSVRHHAVHTGAPVLADSLSWFDCTVYNRVDAGDHVILIGEVRAFGTSPQAPLGFCRGRYASVKDPLPEGWLEAQGMVIGYLVEADNSILLRADGKGGWVLPVGRKRKADTELKLSEGSAISLHPDATFLYSVYDVADTDPGHLIYRAELSSDSAVPVLPEGYRFFPVNEIPYDCVPTRELQSVLRRYARERQDKSFGIYMDSGDGGRFATIDGSARAWSNAITN